MTILQKTYRPHPPKLLGSASDVDRDGTNRGDVNMANSEVVSDVTTGAQTGEDADTISADASVFDHTIADDTVFDPEDVVFDDTVIVRAFISIRQH